MKGQPTPPAPRRMPFAHERSYLVPYQRVDDVVDHVRRVHDGEDRRELGGDAVEHSCIDVIRAHHERAHAIMALVGGEGDDEWGGNDMASPLHSHCLRK